MLCTTGALRRWGWLAKPRVGRVVKTTLDIRVLKCPFLLLTRSVATLHQAVDAPVWLRRKDSTTTPDTIYALSTAPGRAAIAVIRVSGPACLDIYGGLCPNRPFPHPRIATLRRLYDPVSCEGSVAGVLDTGALVLYFPTPNTVTGEDILELHVHGGPATVRSVLEAIPRCTNSRTRRRNSEYSTIRHAEPGEFTKRAFYNGRLDLTQAEALGDTLAAETEQQRRLAVSGAGSGLAKRYEEWRTMLLYARGELEALIDFSEDQHFDESPVEFMASVSKQVAALRKQITVHVKNASRGELLRSGISIALLGAPNAGKSSLLNHIVGREAAIVSAEEGTTRDIVDVTVDIKGWLCRLGDMAGLRNSLSPADATGSSSGIGLIEREGIRRARERALQSDVVIVLLGLSKSETGHPVLSINSEVVEATQECLSAGKTVLVALNKIDLLHDQSPNSMASFTSQVQSAFPAIGAEDMFLLSCKDAATDTSDASDPGGIQTFLLGLASTFQRLTTAIAGADMAGMSTSQAQSYWTASLSITHRQSGYLQQCLLHLEDFLSQSGTPATSAISTHHIDNHDDLVGEVLDPDAEVDIVTAAEHLRFAADCLAKITGKGESGDVEDVLGVVFEK